jgi:hypothetical protein
MKNQENPSLFQCLCSYLALVTLVWALSSPSFFDTGCRMVRNGFENVSDQVSAQLNLVANQMIRQVDCISRFQFSL